MIDRRVFLRSAIATAGVAAAGFPASVLAQASLKLGAPADFSWDGLRRQAQGRARSPYSPPPRPSPEILNQIDYDAHGKIRFKPELALWAHGPSEYPVTFFHLGRYFQKPVRMHVVEDGQAREVVYDNAYFDMPADSPAHRLPDNSGFAGFRFQEARSGRLDWRKNDWVAFLGASYFRAIGELYQYGLSARGVAVDVAVFNENEEFPDFTHVYFETPRPGSDTVTIYALLDGASITGAFRFVMRRATGVTMDIDKSLFLREDVSRLGIAPLTSMYWFSEKAKPTAIDWRPEVHDSDGLAMWTGAGERIWRPLNNPPRIVTSAFADQHPRGFGLLQRDRIFDHYLDGVYYDRRPSLWIEPQGEWGQGSIQLVEIPTDDEIHDNIVAMWVPAQLAKAGDEFSFRYRMYWWADEPFATPLARCVATRLGNGGQAGIVRPRGWRKFMVEFKGKPLEQLPAGVIPEPVLTASRGEFHNIQTEAVPNDVPGHWRTQFDLATTGTDPVELRCFLRNADSVLTETWLYQYHPID
jgi:glucans biosynthesis protein